MKIFIGCSSREYIPEKYIKACDQYLETLFKLDNDLVFGAYNKGLMKLSYQKALKYKHKVIGISPEIFKEDLKKINCHKEIITKSISERTDKLIEESEALIFLPGGIGTIHELFTSIESKRSGEFDKPIIIYNCFGYFDKLLLFLDDMYNQNFTSTSIKKCYYVTTNIEDTIEHLNNYYQTN